MQALLETGKAIDHEAIELLRSFYIGTPFYGGFSGGIDSQVIYDLAQRARVKVEWHYNESPIDPPIIRQFIKENYPDVIFTNHSQGFWSKHFMSKGFPLRKARWCCALIKEQGGTGRTKLLGMRAEESNGRSGYIDYMSNPDGGHWLLPIIRWTNADRWQYISERGIKPNVLYKLGFNRTGCILCPFQGKYDVQLALKYFPKIVNLWKLAAERYVKERNNNPKRKSMTFKTGEEYFNWWIQRK